MASTLVQPRKRGIPIERLSQKERIFCHELMADDKFDSKAAAKAAGYTFPAQAAAKVLKRKKVLAYLGRKLYDRMMRCDITADQVVQQLINIGFADVRDLFDRDGTLLDIMDLPDHIACAVDGIEVKTVTSADGEISTTTAKIKMASRMPALELIAKHIGMLDGKLNVEHTIKPDTIGQLLQHLENGQSDKSNIIDQEAIEAELE